MSLEKKEGYIYLQTDSDKKEYLDLYHPKYQLEIKDIDDDELNKSNLSYPINLKFNINCLFSDNPFFNKEYSNIIFTSEKNVIFKYEYFDDIFYIETDYLSDGLMMHILPKYINSMDNILIQTYTNDDLKFTTSSGFRECSIALNDKIKYNSNIEVHSKYKASTNNHLLGLLDNTNKNFWNKKSISSFNSAPNENLNINFIENSKEDIKTNTLQQFKDINYSTDYNPDNTYMSLQKYFNDNCYSEVVHSSQNNIRKQIVKWIDIGESEGKFEDVRL